MTIKIKKGMFGTSVVYDCPHCSEPLSSSLKDVGSKDTCPDCEGDYFVPGKEAVVEHLKKVQQARANRDRKKEQEHRRTPNSQDRPHPPVPEGQLKDRRTKNGAKNSRGRFLHAIMGNASSLGDGEMRKIVAGVLFEGEDPIAGFKLVRDSFIFTSKRLIIIDRQGLTGKKIEYHSIPYKSITHFAVETAGTFDLDAEIKLWIGNSQQPVTKRIPKNENVVALQTTLAALVCN